MSAKDRAIVARWRAKLAIRNSLLLAARKRHEWNPTNESRALLNKRKAQVREAERVIARRMKRVAMPLERIIQDDWGYHGSAHDGIDLICEEDAPIFAICEGVVIDVRAGGWWGKGARPSPGHPVSDGDGIIQIRCTVDAGPFRKGMHFGYGHAEHAVVREGQKVKAGQRLGRAGIANAWHVHFMANDGSTLRGVGNIDPRPYLNYAQKVEDA